MQIETIPGTGTLWDAPSFLSTAPFVSAATSLKSRTLKGETRHCGSSHSGPTPLDRRCDARGDARGLCVSESLREPGRDHEVCRESGAMDTVDAREELRGLR